MVRKETSLVAEAGDFLGSNLTEKFVDKGNVLLALANSRVDGFLIRLNAPLALESKNLDIDSLRQFATAERELSRCSVKSELRNLVNSIRYQEVFNRCHEATPGTPLAID